MAFLVEQVNLDGNILRDYDTKLSTRNIFQQLQKFFYDIHKDDKGMICGKFQGHEYSIRIKNITYLGNPHPYYKKRIQIPNDLKEFYEKSVSMGKTPLLLGIYTYEKNTIFCDFNIQDFVSKKANNSSAHIYTSDIVAATVDSFFQKVDCFGNRITVFDSKNVHTFLEEIFLERDSEKLKIEFSGGEKLEKEKVDHNLEKKHIKLEENSQDIDSIKKRPYGKHILHYNKSVLPEKILQYLGDFFFSEPKKWEGTECYKKMIKAGYKNKYQPEWPGFFLEFEFENYIEEKQIGSQIRYAQDKKSGGIDLDLFFPIINAYGDLKAHSESSRGIQGNDLKTVKEVLHSKKYANHIYYVVCEHETKKDSECGYVVTKFWNKAQKKENLMSYSNRMKNSVILKKMYVLDINTENEKYLSIFKQGINSNGKPREPKIMIEQDNLKYFSIFEMEL